ncbi:DNA methyltransferase [Mediterraneibacter sp. NSJ-55]|uniref:DNA methyltransferase n=1 Tax=Mediterraneibacter hominis TaxID=2763054 RepID=A0A923LG57_9FIRM|nr:MT-A70 family methyltransferase [Mediterraneibacter hominis]MBC5688105.1 DNA methyltransferase [Mediterraneibacter hominis]
MKVDIFNANKKYNIIYTDPPWQQSKGNLRKCRPNQGKKLDYPTMTLGEIKDIHEKVFNLACEKKHNVFIWSIDKYLLETEQMMQELGYTLHARMIWDKENGIAPAFTVRFSHEYLLWFYKKGNMLMPARDQRGVWTTVFREQSTMHSRKPVVARMMLEKMFPGSEKLELFARQQAEGWDCWGNEI